MIPSVEIEEEGDSFADETTVLFAICQSGNRLGFACFNESMNSIFADSVGVAPEDLEDTLCKLKIACSPTLFLVHPTVVSNQPLLEIILSSIDGVPHHYCYKSLKSSCWNSDNAWDLLCNKLIVKSAPLRCRGNNLWLSSVIDCDCTLLRQAMGALMMHMQMTTFHLDEGMVTIGSIASLPLKSYMRIDEGSLR